MYAIEKRWNSVQRKIDRDHYSGCHIWKGGKNASRHGVVMVQGQRLYVHRIAYQVAYGLIPEGSHIHHVCKNPSCVNPPHLRCLTPKKHREAHIVYDKPAPAECRHGHKGKYKKNPQGRWVCTKCSKRADRNYYRRKTNNV